MNQKLKIAIIEWLIDNPNTWSRINCCVNEFKEYIYNSEGNFLIGGKMVRKFINDADKLLYGIIDDEEEF